MAWTENKKTSEQWTRQSLWDTKRESVPWAPVPTIHESLSQTFEAHGNLANFDPMQLFLGVNPNTGGIETMSMSKPRSFILHGRDFFTKEILQSIALSTRLRENQKKMPITIISNSSSSWFSLFESSPDVNFTSPDSCSTALQLLPHNRGKSPHFLVIDDLLSLTRLAAQSKSVLDFLITRGAESCGVFVLASYGPITNHHVENTIRSWLSGSNLLETEAVGAGKIQVHESTLYVPKP
jgi:hypothetical protein